MTTRVLGNLPKGLLFIVSAPAGTGKTTLVRLLVNEFSCVVESISYTTRQPRRGETHGQHYHFVDHREFEQMIVERAFLEYVELYGEYYGTSNEWVEKTLNEGKHVVLVIDTQGALILKQKLKEATFIFIMPPSLEALKKRLELRQTETPERISERLNWAKKEIQDSQHYDFLIINDDLDIAYQVLRSIVIAQEHRR